MDRTKFEVWIFKLILFGFIGLLIGLEAVIAQDVRATIHKNDKTSIEVWIKLIDLEIVQYREWDQFDVNGGVSDPARAIHKKDIWRIDYADGSTETFPEFQEPEVPTQHSQQPSQEDLEKLWEEGTRQIEEREKWEQIDHPRLGEPQTKDPVEGDPFKNGLVGSMKAGVYISTDGNYLERFGPNLMYGSSIGYWKKGKGIEIQWLYAHNKGNPYSIGVSNTQLENYISPLTLNGYWDYYKKGDFVTYLGSGVGVCFYGEFLSGINSYTGKSFQENMEVVGFEIHSEVGIRYHQFHAELSYSYIDLIDPPKKPGGIYLSVGAHLNKNSFK